MICRVSAPRAIKCSTINLPASKSLSNRFLLINILGHSDCIPRNLSDSDDTQVMLQALKSDCKHVDVGAAGTSMRFLTAYLSSKDGEHYITGSERMKHRPIAILVDALRQMGALIEYTETEGFPPLRIIGGKLIGGDIDLSGKVSSQYISALMMIAPFAQNGLRIHLQNKIVSKPYIAMTISVMKEFGIDVQWHDNTIVIPEGRYKIHDIKVEADWSAASYWYAIAALMPHCIISLEGLKSNSLQGDSAVVEIAKKYGIETHFVENGIEICTTERCANEFVYDFNSQPDLAQTFIVLSCLKNQRFCFTGLESLVVKETDRISALVAEMKKIGYLLTTNNVDTIEWHGEQCECSDEPISTYNDHRMAMAFAPAAIVKRCISIENPMVVTKSYPNFWNDLKSFGFEIE